MYDSIVYKKLSTSKYELQGKRKLFFRSYPHLKDNFVHKFRFMVLADFDSYRSAQVRLQRIYNNRERWGKMCLMNIANAGKFSADRAIGDYAQNIWHISKIK